MKFKFQNQNFRHKNSAYIHALSIFKSVIKFMNIHDLSLLLLKTLERASLISFSFFHNKKTELQKKGGIEVHFSYYLNHVMSFPST